MHASLNIGFGQSVILIAKHSAGCKQHVNVCGSLLRSLDVAEEMLLEANEGGISGGGANRFRRKDVHMERRAEDGRKGEAQKDGRTEGRKQQEEGISEKQETGGQGKRCL